MNAPGSLSFKRLMAGRRRKESEQWGEKEGGGDWRGTDVEREGRLLNKNGREDKQKGEEEEEERRIHNQAEDNCHSHFTLFYFELITFGAVG